MVRIRNMLALLRGQLWPLPLAIALSGVGLAYLVLTYGSAVFAALDVGRRGLWWLYSGDAGTARGLLSSMLSGLMTMTSLVVSVTFVILTLSAQQLGPRLVPTFMGDRQIQAVLGLFIGTILYLLVVLRTIHDTLGGEGVPHLAVTVASGLTVLCLLALLFYVHKIARSIVADNVVEAVARILARSIREMLPERPGPGGDAPDLPPGPAIARLSLGRSGSIQAVDYDRLVRLAREHDLVLRVCVRAGHFVLSRGDHVTLHGGRMDERIASGIREAFVIGAERSPAQDLEFAMRQLVEIGLRALSSGINDPFTAIAVVDRLAAALEEILRRAPQPRVLRDGAGTPRVIADRSTVAGLVDAAFDSLREAASGSPAVLIRMADVLAALAPSLSDDAAATAARRQLERIAGTAEIGPLSRSDRDAVLRRVALAGEAIAGRGPAP